jgi:hypothetical protein
MRDLAGIKQRLEQQMKQQQVSPAALQVVKMQVRGEGRVGWG